MSNINQMLETIIQEVKYTSSYLGKSELDGRVLQAMRSVPREKFVDGLNVALAYADGPLPIGHGQTISQPYMVAIMTDLLNPAPEHIVLEIGTGCGYQTAILAQLVKEIYSIEIIPELHDEAQQRLDKLGYNNIRLQCSDGYYGWQEHAPYDGIIVTAAATHIPQPLLEQLKPGGRMLIPVGIPEFHQELMLIEKDIQGESHTRSILGVAFVPLTSDGKETVHEHDV